MQRGIWPSKVLGHKKETTDLIEHLDIYEKLMKYPHSSSDSLEWWPLTQFGDDQLGIHLTLFAFAIIFYSWKRLLK